MRLKSIKAVEWLPFIALRIHNETLKHTKNMQFHEERCVRELKVADQAGEEKTALIVKDIN